MSQLNATQGREDHSWHIASRWEEYEGEGRANLLRVVGLVLFYGVELANYHGVRLGALEIPVTSDRRFHLAVTLLTAAWMMLSLGVYLCRTMHIFPRSLKFISTGCDILLLTTILALGHGPRSPLVAVYFLVIALAGLRFQLSLVWFATGGVVAGYLFLLGYDRYAIHSETPVERYHHIIVILALTLTGVVVGQILRRVRSLACEYARRLS